MDVGVYFDLRNPPGWRQDWSRLYGFTLEAVQEAEHLGARSAWFTEHHLFEDGYLTQPLTFAAAAAARTRTLRIGTAVVIAPFWKPEQLAEQAVVVDLLSGGRLDLGVGAGYRVPEFGFFGADLARRFHTTDRTVARMRKLWADPGHLPSPVQDPLPVWMGYMGPEGARRAGRMGEGLLSLDRTLLDPYLTGLEEGGHGASAARMTGVMFGYVSEDPERDWPVVADHYRYQSDSYRRYWMEGTEAPDLPRVDPDRSRAKGLTGDLGGFGFGTPERVASGIRERVQGLPAEEVFLFASIAGMPEPMVMEHINTICTKLRPLLADL